MIGRYVTRARVCVYAHAIIVVRRPRSTNRADAATVPPALVDNLGSYAKRRGEQRTWTTTGQTHRMFDQAMPHAVAFPQKVRN